MVVAQIKSLVQKRDRCGVEFWWPYLILIYMSRNEIIISLTDALLICLFERVCFEFLSTWTLAGIV